MGHRGADFDEFVLGHSGRLLRSAVLLLGDREFVVHDIDSPLTASGIEGGADIQLGYRWDRIGRTPLQPYLFGAVNTAGETSYAAVGLSAKFGDRIFVRPGLGIAIHTGSDDKFNRMVLDFLAR